ncbi:MAG: ATP-binding protein [Candidatus Melainabacteria bacterium]|nr:MAG: ATP-binding protein [Candidatus Melainabacteria bacterium]
MKMKNNIILNIKNKSNYISDDKILDLYEKFKRKDNIKFHKSGSGLGLYLAKQIIKEHNGDIFAKK